MEIQFSSVEQLPGIHAKAAFSTDFTQTFRDSNVPLSIDHNLEIIPWGTSNQMPYEILNLIEKDETLTTCQMFNAEVCYGGGLEYNDTRCSENIKSEIEDFMIENGDLASYYLGVCQDFKNYGFAVSVIILNAEGTKIKNILRKEAMYCRFCPADENGRISKIIYGNFRDDKTSNKIYEVIDLLDMNFPWCDFATRMGLIPGTDGDMKRGKARKFAVVTKIPTSDNTYYPIPPYAALFKGKWYNIKQLIGIAKEAKLKNSAPIKYHIEINSAYWAEIFKAEGITDKIKQQARVVTEKQRILDFLTGAENSGKVWFSTFYQNPNGEIQPFVKINNIEATAKEGGDWATDIQEAVNMFCFTMRVHSNLVGSVPGKSQSNNSGSDKRELYTIAQSLQKPYHDLLFIPHKIIMKFNGWKGAFPDCPFIMLTTLDENTDAKKVTTLKSE